MRATRVEAITSALASTDLAMMRFHSAVSVFLMSQMSSRTDVRLLNIDFQTQTVAQVIDRHCKEQCRRVIFFCA